MIDSKSTFDSEIKFLCNYGFPLSVIQTVIANKIIKFNKIKRSSVQNCPVCLRLPWLGGIRDLLSKSHILYRDVIFHPMYVWSFTLNSFWHLSVKMFFPLIIIILLLTCLSVVGRTNQRLKARIKPVPAKIRNFIGGLMDNLRNTYWSSIAEHLINNRDCAEKLTGFFLSSE